MIVIVVRATPIDFIKEKFYEPTKITERKTNVDKFIEVLHTETTWLTSPASTKYHLNKEGGLLEHSIGVAETLLQLRAALAPDISEE